MSDFGNLMGAIDALAALESGVESSEDYERLRLAAATEIRTYESVVTECGRNCDDLVHMQRLYLLVLRSGAPSRSRVWMSVAGATMSRLWAGINGWEA